MKYTEADHERAERAVEALFREVAARYDHASVQTNLPDPTTHHVLRLSCSSPGTTKVEAIAGADQVDLYLGEATWLELRPRKREPGSISDAIRQVVEAAVLGRFEERIREAKGQVIGSRSTFQLPSGKRIVSRGHYVGANVLFGGRRRTVRYEPYR
jgi:hypothetical protein